jgi:hypothetical protein
VGVWRKLKKLGAVLVQDTLWVLPENNRTREQFRWLAAEVIEQGGQANVWVGSSVLAGQEDGLRRAFLEPAEAAYREILGELEGDEPDLLGLSKTYQQTQAHDHLKSPLGERVRVALLKAKGGK